MENKSTEERKSFIKKLENDFLAELKSYDIELSNKATCTISSRKIEIGIKPADLSNRKFAFASEIDLYAATTEFIEKGNEINFGSSGSFDPTNAASYWRTIHAASILKDWAFVSNIVNKYCNLYSEYFNKQTI